MCRLIFARAASIAAVAASVVGAAVLFPGPLSAQRVPGRELLELPIGAIGEPVAIATEGGDGFRNPAALLLPGTLKARGTVATLATGAQDVSAQLIAAAYALPDRTTVGLSLVHAAVSGIARTETDPQSVGADVPYNTLVVSATVARRQLEHVVAGASLRYQTGQLDGSRGSTVGIDGGVLVTGLTRRFDARVGASSFLWSPGAGRGDGVGLNVAGDARAVGRDSLASARVGYSFDYTGDLGYEHYGFATGRLGRWEARAGMARNTAFDDTVTLLRFAIGLHYARYTLGVAREDNPAGLAPTYQFMLSAVLP
jgi:hypothetical protein